MFCERVEVALRRRGVGCSDALRRAQRFEDTAHRRSGPSNVSNLTPPFFFARQRPDTHIRLSASISSRHILHQSPQCLLIAPIPLQTLLARPPRATSGHSSTLLRPPLPSTSPAKRPLFPGLNVSIRSLHLFTSRLHPMRTANQCRPLQHRVQPPEQQGEDRETVIWL